MSITPLDSLEELLDWKADALKSEKKTELRHYKKDKLKEGEPEVLICHDMKGGYLAEESDDVHTFTDDQKPYVFLNWWNIDIFCYFSHHCVTIPPRGYIKVAHEHGCLVMGTFITEWKDGEKICEKMLKDEETIEKSVNQLVALAVHYGFEGWLINIENVLKEEQIAGMKKFVSLLTERMREAVAVSRVIWYDSVIADGKLRWQNQLNVLNKEFYDSCDGIYLNYNWSDENLLNSADFGILNRIYVGVDVFARGCIGEWDCYKPLSKIRYLRMSIALFAPGWISEKYPSLDPIVQGIKFWEKLRPYVSERSLTTLPFSTTFHSGIEDNTFCISRIEPQPLFEGLRLLPRTNGLHLEKEGQYTLLHANFVKQPITAEIFCENTDNLDLLINGEVTSPTEVSGSRKLYNIGEKTIHTIGVFVVIGPITVKQLKIE
ncbi:unnamed protein product [Auanema sp. JU1783]|nr:unnamed protein product [Auanema sp. JU1783]